MSTMVFVGCVLSILSDQLCDVYMNIKSVVEPWEALEHKFSSLDVRRELYVMEQYHAFKMVDDRSSWNRLMSYNLL